MGTIVLSHIPLRPGRCIGNVWSATKTILYTYFRYPTSAKPVDAAVVHKTSGEPQSVPVEVFWLDCTTLPLKISSFKEITSCDVASATTMCRIFHKDKLLLVVAEHLRLCAYNMQNGDAEWTVKGTLTNQSARKSSSVPVSGHKRLTFSDVTANKSSGNLYACDKHNHTIHLISFGGEYLALFHVRRINLLCEPGFACCSQDDPSSLVVANTTGSNSKQYISVVNIK